MDAMAAGLVTSSLSERGRGHRSELLRRLNAGKTLCSEVTKTASNAKFLQQRRHLAFVTQLQSAQHSMLTENERKRKDMQKKLDLYKKRKIAIFRDRVLSRQLDDDEAGDASDPSLRHSQPPHSTASQSSRGGGRRTSSYSVNLMPPGGGGGGQGAGGAMLPAILRVPMIASDDENINSAIQRQMQQHMHRQESMHAQILRSRVHEFCSDPGGGQPASRHSFYITSTRRIAFSECAKSAKGRREVATPLQVAASLPEVGKTTAVSVS